MHVSPETIILRTLADIHHTAEKKRKKKKETENTPK